MYRIIFCVDNIRHLSWFHGVSYHECDTIEDVINFLTSTCPMREREIMLLRQSDAETSVGRIACTSWYSVKKGPDQMTEYTSF